MPSFFENTEMCLFSKEIVSGAWAEVIARDVGNRHGGGFLRKKIPSPQVNGSSSPPVPGDWQASRGRERSHSQSQQGQDLVDCPILIILQLFMTLEPGTSPFREALGSTNCVPSPGLDSECLWANYLTLWFRRDPESIYMIDCKGKIQKCILNTCL